MSHFTKLAISKAFITLLNQKPLDKITVKDIVELCQLNRKTFYYYYQDIFALLEDTLISQIKIANEKETDEDSWTKTISSIAEFAFQNKKAIHHIYNSVYRDKLEKYFFTISKKTFLQYVEKKASAYNCNQNDVELLTNIYTSSMVGMFLLWIENGMKENPDNLIERISVLTKGNIDNSLKNSVNNGTN